jgi:hypothetical protein
VTEVLNYVQFHASDLLQTFRRKVSNTADLPRQEANAFIADYVAGLEGYTYLEGEVPAEVPVPANGTAATASPVNDQPSTVPA